VESELPWRRALHGQQVREREVSVVVPGRPSQRRILTLVARPFSRPTWPAPGAVIMAIDRVQLLARPPERRRLPPYLQNVLTRLCQGRSTEEISTDLNLTVATTRMYVKRLRLRLGARNQAELILRAVELGLHPSHWW
jgi:DNA-binding NarL/FixJ family response regulator